MGTGLNFDVNGVAEVGACGISTFGLLLLRTRLLTRSLFGRGIGGTTGNWSGSLSLGSRKSPNHSILWQAVRQDRQGQRRNLHGVPFAGALKLASLLLQRNEESFKHLVANLGLEKSRKNSPLSAFSPCETVL